jgi:hypothetical protein
MERWAKVKAIYQAALDEKPVERRSADLRKDRDLGRSRSLLAYGGAAGHSSNCRQWR